MLEIWRSVAETCVFHFYHYVAALQFFSVALIHFWITLKICKPVCAFLRTIELVCFLVLLLSELTLCHTLSIYACQIKFYENQIFLRTGLCSNLYENSLWQLVKPSCKMWVKISVGECMKWCQSPVHPFPCKYTRTWEREFVTCTMCRKFKYLEPDLLVIVLSTLFHAFMCLNGQIYNACLSKYPSKRGWLCLKGIVHLI